jgi:hypothetical protein
MSEQVVPSPVANRIVVVFLIDENVKPAKILMGLRTEFGDETLSRTQISDWSHLNKAEVEHMKTTFFAGKVAASVVGIFKAFYRPIF